jgi:hypothetical protein
MSAQGSIGSATVYTALPNRGFTPEQIAERAIARIIHVGEKSHPALLAQAHAFREQIEGVLVYYLREAQRSERTTICGKLREQGFAEIATMIRDI